MKIAIAGMATESCTFSTLPTRAEDFGILRGAALAERYPFLSKFSDCTFVPIVYARALPGGPVEKAVYEQVKSELLAGLHASEWEGVYLDMHGAMYVQGMEDAEGDWIAAVRESVGQRCWVAASYDLHGNVSGRVIENLDILTAYRTAPHVDVEETRERAVTLLVHGLRWGIRPQKAFVSVPVMLPGERTSTEWEPGMSLYKKIEDAIGTPGVIDASILVGYAWADEPRVAATVITLGTEKAAVEELATMLAQAYWDAREQFQFGVPTGTVDECIGMALEAEEGCVFISDSGDNPTAGGVGDVTYFLERLLALGVPDAVYASVADRESVEACHAAGVGGQVTLSLGGKLDRVHSKALAVTGKVLAVETLPWEQYGIQGSGKTNKQAVILVGGVQVIITEQRTPFHHIGQFQRLGIEPVEHKMVVVKIGYLEPELKRAAPKVLLALSPGAVNQDLASIPYQRIRRPMYPLDADMGWEPTVGEGRKD